VRARRGQYSVMCLILLTQHFRGSRDVPTNIFFCILDAVVHSQVSCTDFLFFFLSYGVSQVPA